MAKEYHIDKSLGIVSFAATILGLPLFKKKSNINKYYILYTINCTLVAIDLIGGSIWVHYHGKKIENFTKMLYDVPCLIFSFLSVFKALSFIYHNNDIQELISILKDLEANVGHNGFKDKSKMFLKEIISQNFLLKVLYTINCVMFTSFVLMPMILMIWVYYSTKKLETVLPFLIIYPFDPYEWSVWPIMYFKQSWTATNVVLGLTVIDFAFYVCSSYISIQYHLLAKDLETLVPVPNTDLQYNEANMKERCVYIIQWHQKLFYCVDILGKCYSKTSLLNFLTSSTVICLTGFNAANVEDVAVNIAFSCFLVVSLCQIFFLCWFGDTLMRSSEAVSDAAYSCKWYMVDKRTALTLYIIQIRAQKASKVTACGYADINLTSFNKILSTSWSYFALLNTVYQSTK